MKREADLQRDEVLRTGGYTVMRFENRIVLHETDTILDAIASCAEGANTKIKRPPSLFSREGEVRSCNADERPGSAFA
jgi:hypothetical protein